MLFSVVVALMVVLIAAFWTYQGFFSSLIMFFECVIACMLAFGFYESVNQLWEAQLGPGLGLPIAFMVLFFGSLGLMRVATDKLIKDNIAFPVVVDRAGAAIAGFFSGMIVIGSTLTAIQMLPVGSPIFGFERYTADANGAPVRRNLGIFRPDEFACGLASMLSNRGFDGDVRLGTAKPDYIQALYSSRAVPMSEETIFMKANGVKVNAYWPAAQIDRPTHTADKATLTRAFASEAPVNPANTFIVCNVTIDKSNIGANGKGEIRFRLPNFRLVGPPPSDTPGARSPSVFLACGMTDMYTHRKYNFEVVSPEQRKRLCAFAPTTDFVLGDAQTKVLQDGEAWRFDVAFEVPQDFKPWYLEFKRGGRADLTKLKMSEKPPSYASHPQGNGGQSGAVKASDASQVGDAPGGNLHIANAIEERTAASDSIPIPLNKNDGAVSKSLTAGKLGGTDDTRFVCTLEPRQLQPDESVDQFWVPDGKRLVQLGAEVLKQNNMYSRAIGFANRVLAQVKITDDKGNTYYAIGFYAAAEINGEWKFEIQYNPASEIPERALKQPNNLTHKVLSKLEPEKVKFGFLFVVEPGVKIVSFHPGSGKAQSLDIQVPE